LKSVSQLSDEQLTESLRRSDARGFEEIYRRYWSNLYSFAYHQIGSKEEAEQLVHDVFELLWKRRTEVEIKHLSIYLMVATKYTVNKYIRTQITFRKYQEYLIFQEIEQSHGSEIVHFDDLTRAVDEALKRLPEKTAEIFKMSRLENRSHKDIAAALHLSEKAVEYHVTKSLKFLKNHLQHFLSDN
jgi:RNA polymerase sigma-70 factor (family 1)